MLFAGCFAVFFQLGEFVVKAIEETGDVDLLRTQALAGGLDDGAIQAEALGGLDAGRCAGNSETELVVGHEGDFVHSGCSVEHTRSVGGVDLERSVVGGDERPRAALEEMRGNGDGKRGALFGIGGRAEFVEKDERICIGEPGEAIEVDDVGREGGELGLDGLGVADIGQKCGEDGEAGGGGRNRQAGLGHHCQQCGGFESNGFAAGVGAADDELARLLCKLQCQRNNLTTSRAEVFLEERVTARVQAEPVGCDGGGDAVVVAGKAGAGQQRVDEGEHAGAFDKRLSVAADLTGEGNEDAMNLFLLLFDEAD